jgi:hypothetical protein
MPPDTLLIRNGDQPAQDTGEEIDLLVLEVSSVC